MSETDDQAEVPHDFLLPEALVASARRVIEAHSAQGTTIALAESCTGGLVGAALTEIPGASDVFVAGVVPYSNEAKVKLLGVGDDLIDTFGAVSVASAWAMARGMLSASGADVAVAITGIAGPGGGSAKKPVGTVVFARALKGGNPDDIVSDKRHFDDNGRAGIRLQAALCALELLMPEGAP